MEVYIQGGSYRDLDFEARERLREALRSRLEGHGIRFVQYDWVWDEEDRCLLRVGCYQGWEEARCWVRTLERLGYSLLIQGESWSSSPSMVPSSRSRGAEMPDTFSPPAPRPGKRA